MIKLEVNNGQVIEITQVAPDCAIRVDRISGKGLEDIYNISSGDMVMLLNYYRYIKDNNIQCDFINPNGRSSDHDKG